MCSAVRVIQYKVQSGASWRKLVQMFTQMFTQVFPHFHDFAPFWGNIGEIWGNKM